MPDSKEELIDDVGHVLLEVGTLLMSSGASTGRIRTTVTRISEAFELRTELLITQRALTISVNDNESDHFFSSIKRTSPHGVNFKIVSGISRMSWRVVEEKWTVDQIWKDLERLKSLPHYPRIIILTIVALAGASFCRLAGGSPIDLIIAFIATFCGLWVRQEAHKLEFNPYLCVFFASFTAAMLSGLAVKLGWGSDHAFATSVLYLIPGVPLINTFSDLIDGNIQNGIVRGINGMLISFSIALGLLGAILIYKF
jgi:uncharacterized membrane protein YjjP (DUF1212 family)